MKRSTAISRLRDVAEGLTRATAWPEVDIVEAYVFGALLDQRAELDRVELALVVDTGVDELPWLTRPAHLEAVAALLRFDKLPLSWRWRPASGPVWNHRIRRAARFWTADEGVDLAVIDALADGGLAEVALAQPADAAQLVAQLRAERAVSRRHLADVTDRFYEPEWRGTHKHHGVFPEDHLWWATAGYLEIDDALAEHSA